MARNSASGKIGSKVEVGRILRDKQPGAVKFGLNGHSPRVNRKLVVPLAPWRFSSRSASSDSQTSQQVEEGGRKAWRGTKERGEARRKVFGRTAAGEERRGSSRRENKGSGVEYFNIYHGEIGTRVCCRESLLLHHFPPPGSASLANRRLCCPTVRSDSLSTASRHSSRYVSLSR